MLYDNNSVLTNDEKVNALKETKKIETKRKIKTTIKRIIHVK